MNKVNSRYFKSEQDQVLLSSNVPNACERNGCSSEPDVAMIFSSPNEKVHYCSDCKVWAAAELDYEKVINV